MSTNRERLLFLAATVLFVGTGLFRVWRPGSGAPDAQAVDTAFEAMGTRIDVHIDATPRAHEAVDAVTASFRDVEQTANEWRDGSPLARINAAEGQPTPAPDELRALIHRGLAISAATDGAFDITWAALWGLWDFRSADPVVPSEEDVAARLPHVGWSEVEVDDKAGTVRLPDPAMRIGLGGIAKGWALDRTRDALAKLGVAHWSVSAGGQWALAPRADGRPWRVGIRDPRGQRDDFFAVVEVPSGSVSTSGDYEHYFIVGGVRYHHILDPRTGFPSRAARSATVIADDATLADGLSTALVVLGPHDGLAIALRLGVQAIIVGPDGAVVHTPGLDGRLQTVHPPRPDLTP